ncbi:MAG: DUF2933 domain-containing protein [Patescibacteria group bacterium]
MKLKNSHLFLMILCCLVMFITLLFLPKILSGNFWYFLLILLCPLSHLLMMKFMGHNKNEHQHGDLVNEGKNEEAHRNHRSCH